MKKHLISVFSKRRLPSARNPNGACAARDFDTRTVGLEPISVWITAGFDAPYRYLFLLAQVFKRGSVSPAGWSSAVANIHWKFALCRFPFEPLHSPKEKTELIALSFLLERITGLEPATSTLARLRSTK